MPGPFPAIALRDRRIRAQPLETETTMTGCTRIRPKGLLQMQLPIHVIDAFTSERFKGNQAAVIPLDVWLADSTLQAIAAENNLSETSFLVWSADRDAFEIRWFSPLTEIAFCGHATLASAFVLFEADPALRSITFWAAAVGKVTAMQEDGGRIVMTLSLIHI